MPSRTSRKSSFRNVLRLETLESREVPASLPFGFTEGVVAAGINKPTTMAIAPDGRIFVAEQTGSIRLIKDGALLSAPFLTLDVNSQGEGGVLGIAFDPDFVNNQRFYVYYTAKLPTAHNRVSRFVAGEESVQPGSEQPILDLEPLTATIHHGGAIHFGGDGMLYVAVGENGAAANSQSLDTRLGKLLRIRSDGAIPEDNPFSEATGDNRAIWAMGLRNPFSFAVQPGTGRIFINDVGGAKFEEINDGVAGVNYGWPEAEGPSGDPRFQSPLFSYAHGTGNTLGNAITAGVFYNPTENTFGDLYKNDYFFTDLTSGWIRRLDPATGAVSLFATGLSFPVALDVDSGGSLYYLLRGQGTLYRIKYQPSIGNDNADFATGLYRQVLARDGEAAAVVNLGNSLDSARQPAFLPVANSFVVSAEYRGRLVDGFYQGYLGRAGSPSEVAGWVAQLQQGQPVEGVAAAFLGSTEHYQGHGATNAAWLDAAYMAVLGREPDAQGRQSYLAALAGGATRQGVALSLLQGGEYRSRLVADHYRGYLGRVGSDGEIAFWVNELAQGKTDGQVRAAFVGSAEFVGRFEASITPWLASLYQGFLGRGPDPAGLMSLGRMVLEGYRARRTELASTFLTATEARVTEASLLYFTLLGRQAADTELAGWFNQRQQGLTSEQMQSIFFGSEEYFTRQGSKNEAWLDAAYRGVLGRNADPSGRAFFLDQLAKGASRQGIALALLVSDEYRARLVAGYYRSFLGRDGAQAEIAGWVEQLSQGRAVEQIAADFLGSAEYFERRQAVG